VYNSLRMAYGDNMVMVDNVDRSVEHQIPQDVNEGENSPSVSPFHMDVNIARGRSAKVVSSSESSEHDQRF